MEQYHGTHYADSNSQSQMPYGNIKRPENRRKEIDTHELLKQEMILQGAGGGFIADGEPLKDQYRRYPELTEIARKARGDEKKDEITKQLDLKDLKPSHIKDTYIYFDSTAKKSTLADLANGKISWNLIELNQNTPVENIIEMEIGSFYIPIIPTALTFPQYFFYDRLTLLIEEPQAQSIRAQNATRFHWELDLQNAGISMSATPVNKKFIFQRPFRDISTATFVFRAPLKSVTFQPDIIPFVSVAGSAPARITTNPPHQLPVASLVSVFISGFSSGSSVVDNAINSPDGFTVTVIDAVTLEFPPLAVAGFDFTAIGVVPGNVTIGFRRIAFHVRFRSLTDEKTNGITPV